MKSETLKSFKLDGKPFALNSVPPLVQKIKRFLDGQPATEIFRASTVAAAINSTQEGVRTAFCRNSEDLAAYAVNLLRPVRTKVFGSPKAIAAIKRELGTE